MASAVVIEPMIAGNLNSEAVTAGSVLVAAVDGYAAWADATSGIALNVPGGLILPQINVASAVAIQLTTADPDETNFGITMHTGGTFNGVYDTGMNIGYNLGPNGLRLDAAKTAAYWTIEGTYQYGAATSRTEAYFEVLQTAAAGAATVRPWAVNIEHQSDVVNTYMTGSLISFGGYDGVSTSQIIYQPHGAEGGILINNTTIGLTTNNIQALAQFNAAGSAMINLIKANASNEVEIGSNAAPVYMPGTLNLGAGALGSATLATSLILSSPSYESTYTSLIQKSANALATDCAVAFQISDGTASGHVQALALRGDKRAIIGAPTTTIEDAGLVAGSVSFWLDESGHTLTVKAKYSNGSTIKSGTVALS